MLVRYAVLCHDRQSNVQLCGCEVLCDVRSDDTLAVSHCSVTFLVLTEISSATSAGKLPVSAAMVGVEQQSSAGAMPAQRPLPAGGVPAADMPSMAPSVPYRPPVWPRLSLHLVSLSACSQCLSQVLAVQLPPGPPHENPSSYEYNKLNGCCR